ncbi:MAG: Gfo/Idh/MocA family protein [Bacteroidota bacterium]
MKINAAIIGMGPHGRRFLQSLSAFSQISLKAVVDKDPAKLEGLTLHEQTKKLGDLSQLWPLGVDMILIATNGPSHAPIAIESMQRGVKYVLVTKPVATTLADARNMMDVAKKTGARVAVDHGLRFDKTYNWILENIKQKQFGDLKTLYIQRPGIGLGCLGVHSFDLASMLAGSEVETVTAWVDEPIGKNPRGEQFVDPGGLVIMNFKNGIKAVISQVEDGSGPMSVELNFTGARVRVDEKFKTLEVIRKNNTPAKFERIENPHGQEVSHDTIKLMEAVIGDLLQGEPMQADLSWGILSFEVLLAAYMSHDNGHQPVRLPMADAQAEKRYLPVT